jgi:hypothetical protein
VDVLSTIEPFQSKLAQFTRSGDYPSGRGTIEEYIEMVQEENEYTKLVIGDSVCNQLFNDLQEYNDVYCLAGNNRAVTMAGEYLLIQEFLKAHPKTTDVYLIVGADMLQTKIDSTYGYQYVVIPFGEYNLLSNLEQETLEDMKETFGAFFLQKPVARLVRDSSTNRKLYLSYLSNASQKKVEKETEDLLSEVARCYLQKIYELGEIYDVNIHLLPDPLTDNEGRYEQVEELSQNFAKYGLDTMYPEYFSMIKYYPEEQFMDGVHFGDAWDTQEYFNQVIEEMYQSQGMLEDLRLSESN